MKQALQIAIDYMNDRLEDHDCKYQRHPATEAERINILADIETVKEALAKQEQGETLVPLRLEWEKGYPEDVAFGTQRQMDRLKKWLDKYFAMVQASKQEQGEPVALETVYETIIHWDEGGGKRSRRELARRIVALYTTPQQRKPLTDEQIRDGYNNCEWTHAPAAHWFEAGVKFSEAAHGIKE